MDNKLNLNQKLVDIHFKLHNKEFYVVREVELLEMVKLPNAYLIRYRKDNTVVEDIELLIPALLFLSIIID